MLITNRYPAVISTIFPYLAKHSQNVKKFRASGSITVVASQNNSSEEQKPSFIKKISNPTILVQSGVALLGLGFIDAGYSGDWSRIGVISKEIEDLLKLLAFVVVPLCFYLIFSLSNKDET